MNTKEIVNALRLCAETVDCYEDKTACPYRAVDDCEDELLDDAADLIDKLQALAENGQSAIDTNMRLVKVVESLQAQLADSQRREKAAVECLNVLEPCEFCKHYDENCICARPLDYGNCFEWRGPQEAALKGGTA